MISIIIPAYNQHELTDQCIAAVCRHTQEMEIILVDNGSTPRYSDTGADMTIRNEKNLGFPAAVNHGIEAAKGDIVILLNNDVIVTRDWAKRLVDHLRQFAIIAPMTNYCAGLQRITTPAYETEEELNAVAAELSLTSSVSAGGSVQAANWIIGFCMAFRKSLWEEIGPFDESLWPCSGEEIDFCLRARAAGRKVGIARDVYVHHFGSQTFADMQQAGQINYNQVVDRNNAHLTKKWGESWIKQTV
jgi:GT2 family glycosyltransferase